MIGFRSVLPLIARRSTETLMKTTSDRGKKIDLFQHLQAPHTIFPFPVQDPAVGWELPARTTGDWPFGVVCPR
jgi:hypothetical protein